MREERGTCGVDRGGRKKLKNEDRSSCLLVFKIVYNMTSGNGLY